MTEKFEVGDKAEVDYMGRKAIVNVVEVREVDATEVAKRSKFYPELRVGDQIVGVAEGGGKVTERSFIPAIEKIKKVQALKI